MLIDVHGHLSPPGDRGGPPWLRDPEAVIARKREHGVVLTVIGSPVGAGEMRPRPGLDNYRQTADQVRAHNEIMAELVDRYPQDLRTYAYLDPFGGERMLDQARDLLRDPRFVGLVVNTSVNGEYLGSARARPFFTMAAELGVPVLLHPPAVPVGADSLADTALVEHVGRFCDVTAGLASVVHAGWLDEFPDLVLVAAAGGGGLAFLAEKLDLAAGRTGPGAALRRLYVDTSCPSAASLAANVATFGAGRVLFGTDAPPLLEALAPTVALLDALPPDDREQVGWRTAARLYGLTDAVPQVAGVADGKGST